MEDLMNRNTTTATILVILALGWLAIGKGDGSVESNETREAPRAEQVTIPLNAQEQLIDDARKGLIDLAKNSPTATRLIKTLDTFGVPISSNATRDATLPNTTVWFYVLADENKKTTSSQTIGARFLCTEPPMLVLYGIAKDPLFLGLALAHELVHAEDCLLYGFSGEPMSDELMLYELSAYSRMYNVLNEYTNGRWEETVETVRARHATKALELGGDAHTLILGVNQEESDLIAEIFPGASPQALGILRGQLEVDYLVATSERMRITDRRKVLEQYIYVMRLFYSTKEIEGL